MLVINKTMKTIYGHKKIIAVGIFLVLFLVLFNYGKVMAAASLSDYTALAPIPGVSDTTTLKTVSGATSMPVSTVLKGIFVFAMGFAAAAAVFMIILGGIQYMSTDSITGKRSGKERIQKALIGLGLVISAWVLLYTINPQILSLNFSVDANISTSVGFPTTVPADGVCTYVVAGCHVEEHSFNNVDKNYLCVEVTVEKGGQPLVGTNLKLLESSAPGPNIVGNEDCSGDAKDFPTHTQRQDGAECQALKQKWTSKTPPSC